MTKHQHFLPRLFQIFRLADVGTGRTDAEGTGQKEPGRRYPRRDGDPEKSPEQQDEQQGQKQYVASQQSGQEKRTARCQ